MHQCLKFIYSGAIDLECSNIKVIHIVKREIWQIKVKLKEYLDCLCKEAEKSFTSCIIHPPCKS